MSDARPPSNLAALAALPVAVLDLETTGLDVRRDRIVQVAVLGMQGSRLASQPRLDQLLDPGIPIPPQASAIHHIEDRHVAGAPAFADFAGTLQEALSGRVVVGHHTAFDLLGALEPTLPDLSLEGVTRWLGVPIERRHSALGDAEATAAAFAALVPRLRESDVRTLGEALTLSARRNDLILRQAHSGWHAMPGEAPASPPQPAAPRLDSYVFERSLGDVMSAPPITIGREQPLRAAAQLMVSRRIGALLVGSPDGAAEGILTERDLLRITAERAADLEEITVEQAMSSPVECMRGDEMLYRALGRMDRRGIRHLCVVDDAGRPIGMLSQRDMLQYRARSALEIGDAVSTAADAVGLAAAFGRVPAAAGRLVAEGVGGVEVARVISSELRAVTARASELALAKVELQHDKPGGRWCVMVLGSGGRGESLLAADQDNALIHDGAAQQDDAYAALGAELAELLDESGVPRCKGGVMAANAAWRGTLEVWETRVGTWLERARPEDLLNVDIFFDLMPVAGDLQLAEQLHAVAVEAAARTPPFLALLAERAANLLPLVGHFGRLHTKNGRVDLKRSALLPTVSVARALALRAGSTERSTPGRLRDAEASGRLSQEDAAALIELHAQAMSLVLGQQLMDLDEGIRPSTHVALKTLRRSEAKALAQNLRRLEYVVQALGAAMSR